MTPRILSIAAIVASSVFGIVCATAGERSAPSLGSGSAPREGIPSYRQYVKEQTAFLVGMTKVLAIEIKAGNVQAAQSAYAPAHRYLARIEPLAKALPVLRKRLDGQADAYDSKEADPAFSGFHRIEYGLFAKGSTADLSDYADRLYRDARELQEQLALIEIAPSHLGAEASELVEDVAARRLDGGEERYARTDLWDFEANMDGVQEILALLPSSPREREGRLRHFSKIDELLAKHKDGCGFKSFEELSRGDKMAIKGEVAALAEQLSTLRVTSAADEPSR